MSSDFFQDPPRLGNTFTSDPVLGAILERRLPLAMRREIAPELATLGELAAGEMLALADAAERQPPRHLPYDAWGRRLDAIEVAPAWRHLHAIAAEHGVLAAAYERRHGAFSRLDQLARLYLYHPSSAFASCPLAMTDGAARVLELHAPVALRERLLPRLVSRDPATFWTSGQWMTERTGGSDVSGTATLAERTSDGFRLHGSKWFTSATTAELALALARIEGAPAGSAGLSLFLIELRDEAGRLRGITVDRLKDKLGTRALPTAELTLAGAPGLLLGAEGRGVATVATMLNITRLYNACCAAGTLGRCLALARDYAVRRRAFGRSLAEQPLHVETLARLATEHRAAVLATFQAGELLGREEVGAASDDERAVLRLLTPLVKLATGRQAVAGASETLEAFGGAGYVEDTGLPRLLRDAQVLAIWEGTTNVLALDVLRAIEKDGALRPFVGDLEARLQGIRAGELAVSVERCRTRLGQAVAWRQEASRHGAEALQAGARAFALELFGTYAGALLAEQADWELARGGGEAALAAARRWGAEPLTTSGDRAGAQALVLGSVTSISRLRRGG